MQEYYWGSIRIESMTYLYSNMTQTLSSAAGNSISSKHLMSVEILELSLFKTLDYPQKNAKPHFL